MESLALLVEWLKVVALTRRDVPCFCDILQWYGGLMLPLVCRWLAGVRIEFKAALGTQAWQMKVLLFHYAAVFL